MFTGIVESTAEVIDILSTGSNKTFHLKSPMAGELRVDQSLSHNGVCLTVEKLTGEGYQVTAIKETLSVSNLGNLEIGNLVNLERCLPIGGRLDGHLVQGHVDATATCLRVTPKEGSWELAFAFPAKHAGLVIEKGSICLNGISLTVFNVQQNEFTVAIIPYTYNHTNIRLVKPGDSVNLEFDLIGKYITRHLQLQTAMDAPANRPL